MKYARFLESLAFEKRVQSRSIHSNELWFATYGDEPRFNAARRRITRSIDQTGWFDHILQFTRHDLTPAFKRKYSEILKLPRGGGYWIWKYFVFNTTMHRMKDGDILVYLDAGCTVSQKGARRFFEYVEMLRTSPFETLSFYHPMWPEREWNVDRVFAAFNISNTDHLIRDSGQLIATVMFIQKGRLSEKWLDLVFSVLDSDHWLITDQYNVETKHSNISDPYFRENRHDQGLFSLANKILGTVLVRDETGANSSSRAMFEPKWPFWATRQRDS